MLPNTVTWSIHRDGTMINRTYLAPDDETMEQVIALLGPILMEGMVTTEELEEHKKLQTGVAITHPENL